MCRFVLYAGPPIVMADLLTRPVHSLIHQSHQARLRREPLNGDGFGVGWFAEGDSVPAVYRSLRPAWGDPNLTEISRVTAARTVLAHVRAASPGLEVSEINCHPFKDDRFAFAHNGSIGGFRTLRRALSRELSDDSFEHVRGTTDSEMAFGLWRDFWHAADTQATPGDRMAFAMEHLLALVREREQGASYLNIAVASAREAVVSRWASPEANAPSLFFRRFRALECVDGICRFDAGATGHGVIIASEPFDDAESWEEVPAQSLAITHDGGAQTEIRPVA